MISAVAISAVVLQMSCVAGLLGISLFAIALSRASIATAVIYGATLAVSALALFGSLRWLLGGTADATEVILPIGLPWLGAHFRLDFPAPRTEFEKHSLVARGSEVTFR